MTITRKPEVLILSGLPASRKSTRAKAWVAEDPEARIRVNYDDIRAADEDIQKHGFSWDRERKVKQRALTTARTAINAGLSVVVDNTNLTQAARGVWESLANELGATIVYEEMLASVQECVASDRLRTGTARVGRAVIERMALYHGFMDLKNPDGPYKRQFVIVDVDGTLADCSHRKHLITPPSKCDCGATTKAQCVKDGCKARGFKKNWPAFFSACADDRPIWPIIKLVQKLAETFSILIVSGRALDFSGIKTEEWLDRHGVPYDHLLMRNGGDGRLDTEVKQEILDLLPKERIAYVLDDRDSVVAMWRKNNLTTLQVAEGDF